MEKVQESLHGNLLLSERQILWLHSRNIDYYRIIHKPDLPGAYAYTRRTEHFELGERWYSSARNKLSHTH